MFIPLIPKDPDANDFTCRDGEIDVEVLVPDRNGEQRTSTKSQKPRNEAIKYTGTLSLVAEGAYPTATLRIPLLNGEAEKATLLLGGEISRVDPASAERMTQAIIQKAAEVLLEISMDLRRAGLFLLPFRVYTMTVLPDGSLSYPSPQAIALPTDFPPHPEITAHHVSADCLTLAIRFPVRPHRLRTTEPEDFPAGHSLRTFISYPLFIPDPKEMRGSIGSVRSAAGGNATGIRFAFLSTSAIKASVAAPEKYHELAGNERTGYRLASKAAPAPDYSVYADTAGYTLPFPGESLLAAGADVSEDTDPSDWIADWEKVSIDKNREGYLPTSLPYKFRIPDFTESEYDNVIFPDGIDKDAISEMMESHCMSHILLTRPMALASDSRSRRNATPRAIRSMRVHGLPDTLHLAILYGSDDCMHWEAMRVFDPHRDSLLLTPRRAWWRLMICGTSVLSAKPSCLLSITL